MERNDEEDEAGSGDRVLPESSSSSSSSSSSTLSMINGPADKETLFWKRSVRSNEMPMADLEQRVMDHLYPSHAEMARINDIIRDGLAKQYARIPLLRFVHEDGVSVSPLFRFISLDRPLVKAGYECIETSVTPVTIETLRSLLGESDFKRLARYNSHVAGLYQQVYYEKTQIKMRTSSLFPRLFSAPRVIEYITMSIDLASTMTTRLDDFLRNAERHLREAGHLATPSATRRSMKLSSPPSMSGEGHGKRH